jgi:hypothetical protein
MKNFAKTIANMLASLSAACVVFVLYVSLPPQLYFSLAGLTAVSLFVSSALEDRQDPKDPDD